MPAPLVRITPRHRRSLTCCSAIRHGSLCHGARDCWPHAFSCWTPGREGPTAARAPTTRTALSYSGPALGPPAGADAGYAPLHVRTHTNGTRMQARTNTQTDTRTRAHTHLKPSLTARTAVPHLPRRPSLGCWAWRMKTSNLVDRSCHATGHRHIRPGPRAGAPVGLTCRACCLSTLPSPKLAPAPRGKLAGAQHPLGPLLSQRLQWKRPGTATGGKARSSRAGQRER